MSWKRISFKDLYSEPSRNGVYKSKEHHGFGAKIVNMGELFGYEFVGPQLMKRINMSINELQKSGLQNGDLLFGRRSLVEDGAGKCSLVEGLVDDTTFESSIIRVRLDTRHCVPKFYYYWFKSHAGRGSIKAIVSGTNIKGIRGTELKKILIPVPTIYEQEAIVDTLWNYDNLIENNRRRIALLEEAARQLYKEWFVRFRYPGHEHIPIVDSVPEGWAVTTIQEMAETIGGGTPSTKKPEYWDEGNITWFSPTDLTSNDSLVLLDSARKINGRGFARSSAKMLPPEAILMSSRASVGFFGLFDGEACTNQGFISLIPKMDNTRMYLLFNLIDRRDEIIGLATGTTYKEINKSTFRAMPIKLPSAAILSEFEELAYDQIKQVRLLMKSNHNLQRARDLLLPKLMNGEIAV